jgi:hypothetical protein
LTSSGFNGSSVGGATSWCELAIFPSFASMLGMFPGEYVTAGGSHPLVSSGLGLLLPNMLFTPMKAKMSRMPNTKPPIISFIFPLM